MMFKKLCISILSALTLLSTAVPVMAASADSHLPVMEPGRTGTIIINYQEGDTEDEPVAGAEFKFYKIAEYAPSDEEGVVGTGLKSIIPGLELIDEDIDADKEFKGVKTFTVDTNPEEYLDFVKQAYTIDGFGSIFDGISDSTGRIAIKGVTQGMYVAVETSPAESHYASAPFVLSVPFTKTDENGNMYWEYEIMAQPKALPAGDIIIRKELKGDGVEPERDWHFIVNIDSDLAFPFETSTGIKGEIKSGDVITLKGGQFATVKMIPVGCEYKIVEQEANTSGYATTVTNQTGRVKNKEAAKVIFTNSKSVPGKKPNGQVNERIQTGDSLVLFVGVGIAVIAIIALIVVFVKRGKKSK